VSTGSAAFAVRVDDVVPGGVDEISNTVDITDDGIEFDPAAPVVPSTDSATVDTPLGASPQVEITKDDGGISVNPGQRYAYRIGYRNAGNQAATGVILTETVPDDTLFSAAASAPSVWSCADGSPPGTVCTLFVGLFPAAEPEREARFGLQVLFPARAGLELLFNEVQIEDDGSNSPQPLTDRDEDVTPLLALPDLVIDKRADVEIVEMLDALRCAPVLRGYRGRAGADMQALVRAVCAVQDFVIANPRVTEVEVNPLLCLPEGAVAVDALIREEGHE